MKTLVLGASPNTSRYSNKAVRLLKSYEHEVVPVGIRKGEIDDIEIRKGEIDDIEIIIGKPEVADIHTVTLYVGSAKQAEYYDYILSLKPKRIIFNPGTENNEFVQIAEKNNIETIEYCTLVLLNTGRF